MRLSLRATPYVRLAKRLFNPRQYIGIDRTAAVDPGGHVCAE